MPFEIKWGNIEKTYIYGRFPCKWTWQDIYNIRPNYDDLASSVPHRVDFIADFAEVASLPTNFIANTGKIISRNSDKETFVRGYCIVMDIQPVVQSMISIVTTIMPAINNYIIFVHCLEEALEVVSRNRSDSNSASDNPHTPARI